jgi:uncharacterized membrane protein
MDSRHPSPLVSRPDFDSQPRGSWLYIALVAMAALVGVVILTFLTLGFFGPFVLLGLVIFGIIGLQYLVWGWWFERIYRAGKVDRVEDAAQPNRRIV